MGSERAVKYLNLALKELERDTDEEDVDETPKRQQGNHARFDKKDDGFICTTKTNKSKDCDELSFSAGEIVAHLFKTHKIHPEEQDIKGFTDEDEDTWQKYKKRKGLRIPALEEEITSAKADVPAKLDGLSALVEMKSGRVLPRYIPLNSLPLSLRNYLQRTLLERVPNRVIRPLTQEDKDEEDEPRRKRRDDDEDEDEEKPKKHHRDEDEDDEEPKKKHRRDDDEDDDDEEKPRKRKDEDEDEDKPKHKAKKEFDEDEIKDFKRKYHVSDDDMKLITDWARDEGYTLKEAADDLEIALAGSKKGKDDEDDDEEKPRKHKDEDDDEEEKPKHKKKHDEDED
jgi:hypothetical protein